ncbi:ATP-binding protein [Cohnella mopanensis]|uniref:ATP-binding protein n=1 Tax=Cohnella mopanensis TaxID=2911966 RepID=UPI0034E1CB33
MLFSFFLSIVMDNWNNDETTIKVIDIIKIMGNLVDNTFDETEILPQDERQVHASIRITDDNGIELQISNKGSSLQATDRERIFQPGYSTKGEGHSDLPSFMNVSSTTIASWIYYRTKTMTQPYSYYPSAICCLTFPLYP